MKSATLSPPLNLDLKTSAPRQPLPAGAWDTHAHVLGPFDRYPLRPDVPVQPPEAGVDQYVDMLDCVGFSHGCLVHAAAHGYDNSAVANAVKASWPRLRGIAVVPHDVDDTTLAALNDNGVRGIRFVENTRFAGTGPGSIHLSHAAAMAKRLQSLNWHIQVWAPCADVMARAKQLRETELPIVLDHMGFPPNGTQRGDPLFRDFLALLQDADMWVKLTPHRLSNQFPDAEDVRQLHDALIETIPDRLLWGSDWPFLGMGNLSPDVGQRIDLFDSWTPDADIRQRVFVSNPDNLFKKGQL